MKITCRNIRRGSGCAAAVLWFVAVLLTVVDGSGERLLGWELLVTGAAASTTVMAGIGYVLSRGSAEAVYQIGHQVGYADGVRSATTAAIAGGNVLTLPVRSSG